MIVSMFERARPVVGGLVLAAATAACTGYEPTGLRGDPVDLSGVDGSLHDNHAIVHMYDFSASPGGMTIEAGTAVEWKNVSSQTHSVSNYSTHPQADTWVDTEIGPGGEFSHVFTEPGEYGFICIHHMEVGYITVVPAPGMDMDMDMDMMDMDMMMGMMP